MDTSSADTLRPNSERLSTGLLLIAAVLCALALKPAIQFGATWSLRARPLEHVVVSLKDGRRLEGELSREWSQAWVMRNAEGQYTLFREQDYDSMAFPLPRPEAQRSELESWRFYLPPALVLGAFAFLVLAASTRVARKRQGR